MRKRIIKAKLPARLKVLQYLPVDERAEIARQALARYESGEQIGAIAKDHGISDVTLYCLLLGEHADEWQRVQVSRALARHSNALHDLDLCRAKLDAANDLLELARQREHIRLAEIRAKRGEWELEKLFRRLYGDDVPRAGDAIVHVHIGINRKPNTIEGEVHPD